VGVRATARNGRLIVDEETQEGTVLDPVIDDESNDLEEAQHRILDSAISEHRR
jgi:hypothetical protein